MSTRRIALPLGIVFLLLTVATLVASCGAISLANGIASCGTDAECPPDYHCAVDLKCWANGQDPFVMPDATVVDSAFDGAPRCPDAQFTCGGSCIDPQVSREFCGATPGCGATGGDAGKACPSGQVCAKGVCALSCPADLVDCKGGCVNPKTSREYCGATAGCGADSGSAGKACDAGEVCSDGACSLSCAPGLIRCGATCIDPLSNRNNCGATAGCGGTNPTDGGAGSGSAGAKCSQGQVCSAGTCAVSCQAGLVNCAGNCVDPQNSRGNCGATDGCGVEAGSPGTACSTGQVCSAGACSVSCQAGLVNCGGSCVDPLTNRTFCGAAGACAGAQAGTTCTAGQVCNGGSCSLSCQAGLINCGGTCIDPQTSRTFCGAAGTCLGAQAGTTCGGGQVCNAGTCSLSCQAGLINCGGTCIDPLTSRNFCGAAGACAGAQAGAACGAGQVCNAGTCSLSCQAGLVNCAGTCVDPLTSRNFCGATGNCVGAQAGLACAGGNVCSGGFCSLSCQPGLIACGGTCIDPLTSRNFCGASGACAGAQAGTACGAGNVCNAGTCSLSCQAGLVNCGGTCIDPATSRAFCGASGTCAGAQAGAACGAGSICNAGTCQVSCPGTQVSCSGNCVSPASDPNFCGASGSCAGAQSGAACSAVERCSNGTCCPSGFVSCGGSCINPQNNAAFCGASGTCAGAAAGTTCGGGQTCSNGACVFSGTTNYVITTAGPLTNLGPGGGCAPGYQNNCSASFGFSWTDTTSGPLQSATIQFALRGTCATAGTVHAVTLNGTLIGSYTNTIAAGCNCTVQPVTIIPSTLASYVQGGNNTLLISSSTCETLEVTGGNVLATVGVTYNAALPVTAGLLAHYNARNSASVTRVGANVTAWNDVSGNNHHMTVNGVQPLYNAALINGRAGVDFSGSAGLFTVGNPALASAVTVFVATQWRNPAQWGPLLHHGSRDQDWSLEQSGFSPLNVVHWQTNNDNAGLNISLTTNTNYILAGRLDAGGRYFSASSTAGGLVSTTGSASSTLGPGNKRLYMGKSDANEASNAYIGEVLYYNRSLSNAERDAVVAYLRAVWGI